MEKKFFLVGFLFGNGYEYRLDGEVVVFAKTEAEALEIARKSNHQFQGDPSCLKAQEITVLGL